MSFQQIAGAKLLREYALETSQENPPAAEHSPQQFLTLIQQAAEEPYESIGLGQDVWLSSAEVSGSGLLWDDQVIHASVFYVVG